MTTLQEAAQQLLDARDRFGWSVEVDAYFHKLRDALASEPQAEPVEQPVAVGLSEYKGVRCACIATKCRAGPGCPLYTANCAAHISHAAQAPRPAWDGTYRDFCPGGSRCLRGCYSNEPCRDEAPKGSVAATQGDAP